MKIATNLTLPFLGADLKGDEIISYIKILTKTRFRYADLGIGSACFEGSAMTGSKWRQWADKILETARNEGIVFVQAHSSDSVYEKGQQREYADEMIKRQIEVCGILGIPHIVVHNLYKFGITRRQQRAANKEFYGSLLETAEKNDVGILLENGCYQISKNIHSNMSAEQLLEMIADLGDHPLVNVCWDVGHAHFQGIVNQYDEINELGSRLKALHIHDNFGGDDSHMAPFSGSCGYDAIIKGLLDIGYGGYFTLESFSSIMPSYYIKRKGHEKIEGQNEKLVDLPLEITMQGVNLLYEIAKYMLVQYECFEE